MEKTKNEKGSLALVQVQASQEKELGNEAYKVKNFEQALAHYDKAIELDPTNMTYLTNKAAVYLEQKKFDACIKLCKEAIKIGRENKSDCALIARAHERIGNAYSKMGDLKQALKHYEDSLSEQINQNVQLKKQEIEKKIAVSLGKDSNNNKVDDSMHKRLKELFKASGNPNINNMEALNELRKDMTITERFPHLKKEDCIDERVQPFVLDRFPEGCDVMKCIERLSEMFENTRCAKFQDLYVKMKEYKPDIFDLIRRLGNNAADTVAWYSKGQKGSINDKYSDGPYDPRILHSYTNEPVKRDILPPGGVHVSVGFTDLSLFYSVEYSEGWSASRPLKWSGYEASAYCVSKTAVVVAMIESGAAKEEIMQVWYSAAWSLGTLKSFRTAIKYLQNNKSRFKALSENEVTILLDHWSQSEVSLKESREKWLANCTEFSLAIGNFKQAEDRKALCAYALTGELLKGEVGSVVMWSFPKGYIGKVSYETVFHTIDFCELIKHRLKCSNIMQAAVEYFKTGVDRLRKLVREKSVIIELNFKIVSAENKAAVEEISALNPSSISWSNVCDYMSPKKFHSLARKCSGRQTLHFAYTMNWGQRVFGSSVLDYNYSSKQGSEFYDQLVKTSSEAVGQLYDELNCKSILHFPPVGDSRQLANSSLLDWMKKYWVEYFFSKALSGVESMEKQVVVYKTFFTVMQRSQSTIFFIFTYDPTCSFMRD